jgi:hypothetical protein
MPSRVPAPNIEKYYLKKNPECCGNCILSAPNFAFYQLSSWTLVFIILVYQVFRLCQSKISKLVSFFWFYEEIDFDFEQIISS